jgi:DNA-directed RNA polymerase subunit RPC12/RpoP
MSEDEELEEVVCRDCKWRELIASRSVEVKNGRLARASG